MKLNAIGATMFTAQQIASIAVEGDYMGQHNIDGDGWTTFACVGAVHVRAALAKQGFYGRIGNDIYVGGGTVRFSLVSLRPSN
jgi:hypothetical protein